MFDNHTHSKYSTDSTMSADDAVLSAIENSLDGIVFTDHVDLDYPDFSSEFYFDIKEYSDFIDQLKLKYQGTISVLKGIEMGIQPQIIKEAEEIVRKFDFDFVIASIHIIDYLDPYFGKYYEGKTKKQAYDRYLQTIYDGALNFKDYDVIGHIGYIRRYGNFDDRSMNYVDYSDTIDSIFKVLIEEGKGIEVNTSGLRGILGTTIPDISILKRYKQLGGEIITIGSDAHKTQDVGANFRETIEQLLSIGFKYTCHFEKRKPIWEKLD